MSEILAIFAKAPVAGLVKTRLLQGFTEVQATEIYRAALHDIIERAMDSDRAVVLFYDPTEGAASYFESAVPKLRLQVQKGADLGERLADAFDRLFAEGADKVLIIGGDSPTLPVPYLDRSADILDEKEVVFGPTEDGGYYLVGIRSEAWPAARAIFRGIRWSTETVLMESVAAARDAGLAAGLADPWYDLDRPEDVNRVSYDLDPGSHLGRLLRSQPELVEIARRSSSLNELL